MGCAFSLREGSLFSVHQNRQGRGSLFPRLDFSLRSHLPKLFPRIHVSPSRRAHPSPTYECGYFFSWSISPPFPTEPFLLLVAFRIRDLRHPQSIVRLLTSLPRFFFFLGDRLLKTTMVLSPARVVLFPDSFFSYAPLNLPSTNAFIM